MQTNTIFTMIIGFLIGAVLYLMIIELDALIMLITTGVGYFAGEILDTMEKKGQEGSLSFTNLVSNQEIYQVDGLPEALVLYITDEQRTVVRVDFRIEAKPQNFRLSVLKNLQNFQFHVIEDAQKTVFSLTLDFPGFNYPHILEDSSKKNEFHLAIKERALDFSTAVTKIIPGLVLTPIIDNMSPQTIHKTDLTSDQIVPDYTNNDGDDNSSFRFERRNNIKEVELEPVVDESVILADLAPVKNSSSQTEEKTTRQEITPVNNIQQDLESTKSFLSETRIEELADQQLLVVKDGGTDVKEEHHESDNLSVDYSAVIDIGKDTKEKEVNNDFDTLFTDQLEQRIKEKKNSLTST